MGKLRNITGIVGDDLQLGIVLVEYSSVGV